MDWTAKDERFNDKEIGFYSDKMISLISGTCGKQEMGRL
jgi:hypothetical protein